MALILNGTSQYAYNGGVFGAGSDITALPFTIFGWAKPTNNTASMPIAGCERSGDTLKHVLQLAGNIAGTPLRALTYAGGWAYAETSGPFVADVWQCCVGVWVSSTERKTYINGNYVGTDATSKVYAPSAAQDGFALGTYNLSAPTSFMAGRLGKVAVWSSALSEADILRLSAGADPTTVSPATLQNYWTLESDYSDSIGGDTLIPVGSPTFDATDLPLPSNVYPYEKITTKKLVAIGGHSVYVGDTLATLAGVAEASGDVNCTHRVATFENSGKVFIANKDRYRILDLQNTKLSTADIAPAGKTAPSRGALLSGVTSGANMWVDYIDATDGAALIYGKRTSTETFVSGETVNVGDGSVTQFVLNADEDAPNHWYEWTEYGGASANMPSQATLACLWRNRPVLSGNPENGTQWWMGRSGNPYDFDADGASGIDALRPMYGGLGDAGNPGDVIRAIIPFNDTYLLFACASTIYVLMNDPASGGQVGEIKGVGGILDSRAWAWDDKGNLYILTTFGLMRITKGWSAFENLTELTYPTFVKDLAFSLETDRLILQYDVEQHGLQITKTVIDPITPEDVSYFYDPRTGGLFKDDLQTDHTVFSAGYFDADDPNDRVSLYGCFDGFLRSFQADQTSDDDIAIDSFIDYGPIRLSEGEGKIFSVEAELGDGDTTSDPVTFKVWVDRSADAIVKKLLDNTAAPNIGGTFKSGRRLGGAVKREARGAYAGVKLRNNTVDETWSFEKLVIGVKPSGRIK